MSIPSWFRAFSTAGANQRRASRRPQLRVEALEDRLAPATLSVTNANDGGPGSLRQAILDSNASPGIQDTIDFAIPGTGTQTINLVAALPFLTDSVILDGTTQPGYAGQPLIDLFGPNDVGVGPPGSGDGTITNGLVLLAGATQVRGLAINHFSGTGILVTGPGGNVLADNFIGTDATGALAVGTDTGILLSATSANQVVGNVVSGNTNIGIALADSSGNVLSSNLLGTNASNTAKVPNGQAGLVLSGASSNNLATSNVIAGNGTYGAFLSGPGASGNQFSGNYIGVSLTGAVLANGFAGVGVVGGASANSIGGTSASARNYISGNAVDGVYLAGDGTSGNLIGLNSIGTDPTGTAAAGNGCYGVEVRDGAANNVIGSDVISGNGQAGVLLSGPGTSGNVIGSCLIGTDSTGTAAVGDGSTGVIIQAGASSNVLAGDVIAGVAGLGEGTAVLITDVGTSDNTVQNCLIGANATATAGIDGTNTGALITDGASGNLIGGTKAQGNLIVGTKATGVGVNLAGTNKGNQVLDNRIGLNASGKMVIGDLADNSVSGNMPFSFTPPTATFGNSGPTAEGNSATVTFTAVAGGSGGYTYSYDFNNDDVFEISDITSASALVPSSYLNDGPSARVVHGRITDSEGVVSDFTTSITVTNVAPIATLSVSATTLNEGGSLTATLSNPFDPSGADTSAGFHYSFALSQSALATSYSAANASNAQSLSFDDNGAYTVWGRVLDKDGGLSDYSATVTVTNVAPTATLGPVTGSEGSPITVSLSNPLDPSRADAAAGFHYKFALSLAGLAGSYATASASNTKAFTFDDNGTYTVWARIIDKDGGFTYYSTTVTVADVPPTATLGLSATTLSEGGSLTATLSNPFDPSSADTTAGFHYSLALSKNALATSYNAASAGTSQSFTFDDNGAYTVWGRIFDKDGGLSDYSATVTVTNVAPTATLSVSATTLNEGGSLTATLSNPFDPSNADTSAGFRYSFALSQNALATSYSAANASNAQSLSFDDNGAYTVWGRVLDKDGGLSDYSATVTVTNVAPTATLGPVTGSEGSPITVSLSNPLDPSRADAAAGFHYKFALSLAGLAGSYATASASNTKAFTFDDNGTYTVWARIIDKDGGFTYYSTTVTVNNVAPTATLSVSAATINEGSSLTATLSNPFDPSNADTAAGFHYRFALSQAGLAGSYSTASASNSQSLYFDDNGTYTVWARIIDKDGGLTDYTTSITVNNVAPTPTISAPSSATPGSAVTFSAAATDPSTADSKAGFSYAWTFGDGGSGTGASVSHNYAAAGTYTVKLTVTDKDGGQGSTSSSVTVGTSGPPPQSFHFDFGIWGSPVAAGATGVLPNTTYNSTTGYGWISGSIDGRDRGIGTDSTRDFNFTSDGTFAVDLVNGDYLVTIATGDMSYAVDKEEFSLQGHVVDVLDSAAGQVRTKTYAVTVSNGQLDLRVHDLGGISLVSVINSLDITPGSTQPPSGPSAAFGNNGPVGEGGTATVSFSNPSGGSGGYVYSFDLNNDGTFDIVNSSTPTATVPASLLDDGPTMCVVVGRITDSSGAHNDFSTLIVVNNVPPTANLAPSFTGSAGTPMTFSASATDPSKADTAAGFSYAWNFGDGGKGSGANPSYIYANPGTYAVSLTVTDKDGGSSTATTKATVLNAGAYIITPWDKIPNFGVNPNIVSVHSGAWSDPNTWSLGRVPGAGDVVSLDNNTTVTYDAVSSADVDTVDIQAGSHLVFRTDITTKLTVTNLLVLQGGELQVGSAANPVAAGVKAEIVIADTPLDTTKDPAQYGHGLIALGKVTMHGTTMSNTFVKLAAEPQAGATTLALAQPVTGWRVGDRIVLPDSRQLQWETRPDNPTADHTDQTELATVAGISADGLTVTLSAPLTYSHLGARNGDGQLVFLPYVGDISRNVVVHSANPLGTRGYTLFTRYADVDIEYAQFTGLGRTTNDEADSTTFDSSGNVTHVGTNEMDRFPIGFEHLIGPAGGQADGYQYTFVGNSVFCPIQPMNFRWGITINDSHYGLVQDNVLYNWAGAGLITESGNETGNVIAHNYVVRIVYSGIGELQISDDNGRAAAGMWFRGFSNYVRDNVVADASKGFDYWAQGLWKIAVPVGPGSDTSQPGQYKYVDMLATPITEFSGNEAFGGTVETGLTIYSLESTEATINPNAPESVIKDFHVWHVNQRAYYNYKTNHLTFDGLVALDDFSLLRASIGGTTALYSGDYMQYSFTVKNSDIEGFQVGFEAGAISDIGFGQLIVDSYMRNYTDIEIDPMYSQFEPNTLPSRTVTISNVRFAQVGMGDHSDWGPQSYIWMSPQPLDHFSSLINPDVVYVYAFNGVTGDNFRLYYAAQAADAILPQTTYYPDGTVNVLGSPVAGLTNQQNWDTYGIAFEGAIAPSNATTRANVVGLVSPI